MATAAQKIFKKIVLHNKMMNAATIDRLLGQMPDPEVAVKFLVKREKLSPKKAGQLLKLYRKQLEKHSAESGESQVLRAEKPKDELSPDESFAAMFDEIVSGSPVVAAKSKKAEDDELLGATAAEAAAGDDDDIVLGLAPGTAAASDSRIAIEPLGDDAATDDDELLGATAGETPAISFSVDAEDDELPILELDTGDDEDEEEEEELEIAPVAVETPTATEPKPTATPAKPKTRPSAAKAEAKKTPKASTFVVDPKAKELIHNILRAARKMHASDVHITSGLQPIVRVAGSLKNLDMPPLSEEQCEKALLTLPNEQRREKFIETHDLDFCYDAGPELGRFRTNFMLEQAGMDAVFRLIDTEVPSFEKLHLPDQAKRFTEYSVGIVLITGPKGCGKTTTLAAMVDMLNANRKEHIILIEDPIEYVHTRKRAHLNQREVGTHTKTFGTALRAALREAPDIIVVGEMRDLETTSLAITAAETGHLVLATMHTPDAIRTIDRVLDVFPPKEQSQIRAMLSESLRGVVSQALVPSVDGKSLELAVEILVNTPAIGNMIRENRTFQLRGMIQTGRKLGMVLMDDSLIKLVQAGRISKEDAISRATEEGHVRSAVGTD